MARVLLLSREIDIYSLGYVESIPSITQEKTFEQSKLIDNQYSITCDDQSGFFTDIALSTDWQNEPIKIYDNDNELIWDGIIIDISLDDENETAVITSSSKLSQRFSQIVEYFSSDFETAPGVAKSIMDSYGFTQYNATTLQRAITQCENASCYIRCFIDKEDNTTLRDAIEKLAQFCTAYVYVYNNILYFEPYEENYFFTAISINGDDPGVLMSRPKISFLIDRIVNDYEIGYIDDFDVPATDENSNNLFERSRDKYGVRTWGRSITSNDSGQIQFKDKTSAVWLGEQGMKQSHASDKISAPIQITLDFNYNFKTALNLNTVFSFTYSKYNWTGKVFQIFRISKNEESQKINVMAIEV